jgi:heme exporter protein B
LVEGLTTLRPSWPRQLRALLLKDLRLELRTRDTAVAMVLFAILAMMIFQFAFGSRLGDLTPFAGGILWATLALTAVLGVGRSWVPEREQRVLDGILTAPVPRLVLLVSKAGAIYAYLLAVEIVAVPLLTLFFVRGQQPVDVALVAVVCLLANVGISILGSLLACLALFARARELLLPVLFLPSMLPVVIAAAGATHAVLGGTNDLAEYRGYCLFLAVYAVIFGLVAYATYDHVFDD